MGSVSTNDSWRTVSGLPWKGVRYFCTTRLGGSSTGPWSSLNFGEHTEDDPDQVALNRQRLRTHLPSDPLWLRQVHGADVVDADLVEQSALPGTPPDADAAVTAQPNRVLAVMTADCLPVVLASADGGVLGVAHAGWRGLAAGVLENTLQALKARAKDDVPWRAWIGPAISQSHFEVGEDVYRAFTDNDAEAAIFFAPKPDTSKWLADLPGLARRRLYAAGVGSIELSGQCTYAQADLYYSYRRAALTGRLATVAWIVS